MSFYGDNVRWFTATVLSVADPHERGRVQVRIHGIHSDSRTDIPDEDYPWAETMMPATEGGSSGVGRIVGLQQAAVVFGIFLDGSVSQAPLVLGSLVKNEKPTPSQIARSQNARQDNIYIPGNYGPNGTIVPQTLRDDYSRTVEDNSGGKVSNDSKGSSGVTGVGGTTSKVKTTNEAIRARRLLAFKFLMSQKGPNGKPRFTVEQAAGIVGNMQAENSKFDPGLQSTYRDKNGRREPSFGLCQWNADAGRFQHLQAFAKNLPDVTDKENGWNDFFVQMKFLVHELYGKNDKRDGGGSHRTAYDRLIQTSEFTGYPNGGNYNKVNATWVFMDKFENPADKPGKIKQREDYAEEAYMDYQQSLANAKEIP